MPDRHLLYLVGRYRLGRRAMWLWILGILLSTVSCASGATSDVTVDAAGRLWAADPGSNVIRVIDGTGAEVMTVGSIGAPTSELACFGVVESAHCGDGSGSEARFGGALALTFDPVSGNIFVADTYDATGTVRAVTPSGVVSTYVGTSGLGSTLDGTGATARFSAPAAIAADRQGNLYVSDELDSVIRRIAPGGIVTTLAGAPGLSVSLDGERASARFDSPHGITVDGHGKVYVADTGSHVIRTIAPSGQVGTLAGSAGAPGLADGIGQAARFSSPRGLAIDEAGNVYVADSGNDAIRRINSAGEVRTLVAGSVRVGSTLVALKNPEHIFVFGRTLYVVLDDQIIGITQVS